MSEGVCLGPMLPDGDTSVWRAHRDQDVSPLDTTQELTEAEAAEEGHAGDGSDEVVPGVCQRQQGLDCQQVGDLHWATQGALWSWLELKYTKQEPHLWVGEGLDAGTNADEVIPEAVHVDMDGIQHQLTQVEKGNEQAE
jgi:hypothetical protein